MSKQQRPNFQLSRNWGLDWHSYFKEFTAWRDAGRKEDALPVEPRTIKPGVPVDAERVLKRNKNGSWSTASTMGKVAVLLWDVGWDVRFGESSELQWLAAATHSKRVTVVGSVITLNGDKVTINDLKEAVQG
jgi:hypothetical protein